MAGPHGTYDGRAAHSGRETDAFRAEMFKLVLDALEWHWGEAYKITVTADGWSAERRDGVGEPLRADSPDALRDAILADYSARPVPRDLPGDSI